MPFWTDANSEPRRSHRFLLTLPKLDGYQQYLAKKAGKPSYQVTAAEHKFLGNTYYYPGIVTWQPVSVTIVNSVKPDGNKLLMDALALSGYMPPNQQWSAFSAAGKNPSTVNKFDAIAQVGEVVIQELNGQGILIGAWTLKNSFITDAKFGDLDYDNDTILNIDITFRYDWAEYATGKGDGRLADATQTEGVIGA